MAGADQATFALRQLQNRLVRFGFRIVQSASDADLIGTFSIGTIRRDPLAGWIADQADLVLTNPITGELVGTISASPEVVTPTVAALVESIAASTRKALLGRQH